MKRPTPARIEEIKSSDCFSTVIKNELEAEIEALRAEKFHAEDQHWVQKCDNDTWQLRVKNLEKELGELRALQCQYGEKDLLPDVEFNPEDAMISGASFEKVRKERDELKTENESLKTTVLHYRYSRDEELRKLKAENKQLRAEIDGRIKERLDQQQVMINLEKRIARLRESLGRYACNSHKNGHGDWCSQACWDLAQDDESEEK